jgi:hypothetical protein
MNPLKIYVLPSIKGQLIFHCGYLKPKSKPEQFSLFASYVTRKWRFQISDYFGSHFHKYSNYQLHYKISDLTTRKATDEYFFKQIPAKTSNIEFVVPNQIDIKKVQQQLKYYILESPKYSTNLLFAAMLLPTNIFLQKYLGFLFSSSLLTYHLFRVNNYFRAYYGSNRMQTLLNRNLVTFTHSKEFDDDIIRFSKQVENEFITRSMQAESKRVDASLSLNSLNDGTNGESLILKTEQKSVGSESVLTDDAVVLNEPLWKFKVGEDLHDDVIDLLGKKYKQPELIQTVRRCRMQYYLKGI